VTVGEKLWMDDARARIEAAKLLTDTARAISGRAIMDRYPDPLDAQKVQKALMTADLHLTWADSWPPRKDRSAKIVGAAASPLLVPVIGCLWVIWWMESIRVAIIGKWRARRG
jgi:hypothetical protein